MVSTTPNGSRKKQQGYNDWHRAVEHVEYFAHAEPLNDTELVVRGLNGDITLKVV